MCLLHNAGDIVQNTQPASGSSARYMTLETIAPLSDDPLVMLSAVDP